MFLPSNITLAPGDTGEFVAELQRRLATIQLYPSETVTGNYDGMTTSAVTSFQMQQGLHSDGVAGPETLRRLNGVLSGTFNASQEEKTENAAQQTATMLDQIALQESLQAQHPHDGFTFEAPKEETVLQHSVAAQIPAYALPAEPALHTASTVASLTAPVIALPEAAPVMAGSVMATTEAASSVTREMIRETAPDKPAFEKPVFETPPQPAQTPAQPAMQTQAPPLVPPPTASAPPISETLIKSQAAPMVPNAEYTKPLAPPAPSETTAPAITQPLAGNAAPAPVSSEIKPAVPSNPWLAATQAPTVAPTVAPATPLTAMPPQTPPAAALPAEKPTAPAAAAWENPVVVEKAPVVSENTAAPASPPTMRQRLSSMIQKIADYMEAKLPPSVIAEVQKIGLHMAQSGMREVPLPNDNALPSPSATPTRGAVPAPDRNA